MKQPRAGCMVVTLLGATGPLPQGCGNMQAVCGCKFPPIVIPERHAAEVHWSPADHFGCGFKSSSLRDQRPPATRLCQTNHRPVPTVKGGKQGRACQHWAVSECIEVRLDTRGRERRSTGGEETTSWEGGTARQVAAAAKGQPCSVYLILDSSTTQGFPPALVLGCGSSSVGQGGRDRVQSRAGPWLWLRSGRE